jgi:flagellar hook-associated protein 1 FlgK
MSLTEALSSALTGLNAAQTGLALVAGNVANAQTPGYVRKTATLVAHTAGSHGAYVQVGAINRVLDQFVQAQVRTEASGAGYATLRSNMYDQLQSIYGSPNSASTLEDAFNNFTTTLQALTTSPGDRPTQIAVISAAQGLTQTLNQMTSSIQTLRSQAELGLSDDVTQANDALQQIAALNVQLGKSAQADSATAGLEDQRDAYIDKLSSLMDIRVIKGDNRQVTVFTTSGVQLVGTQASTLSFDPHPTVTAESKWSGTAADRTLGTITLTSVGGTVIDLVASGSIRSGEIAGYLDMRDNVLVQAQAQIDQFAAAMSSALSDTTTDGTAATAGLQTGFDVDIGSLQDGNTISLTYTDNSGPTQYQVTFVRVDDTTALPLLNTDTVNPNDTVVGLDFSGGMASVIAQINTALTGSNLTISNPAGTTLRIIDDGGPDLADVDALSTTATATATTGSVALPFFLDNTSPYTGAITSVAAQSVGLAGRINVNAALITDPTLLTAYTTGIEASDGTRAGFIYDQLAGSAHDYSPSAGIGTAAAPYNGTLGTFLRQFISQQGEAANNANNLKQGQDVVLNSLQQRFEEASGVNIDQEMSDLLSLQNAYAANARVMSTVKEMLAELMRIAG